jgi:hypothetical protein
MACVWLAATAAAACGTPGESSKRSAASGPLRLDEASKQIILHNNTDRTMITGSSYDLEVRSGEGWASADSTLDRILGKVDVNVDSLMLIQLAPGAEHRYSIDYLDQLPSGEYRVIVATGDNEPKNQFDSRHTLTFTR